MGQTLFRLKTMTRLVIFTFFAFFNVQLCAAQSLHHAKENWSSPYRPFVEKMLVEHTRLTHESVIVWFEGDSTKPLESYKKEVFEKLKDNIPKPPDTVLIVLKPQTGEAVSHVGIGFDSEIADQVERTYQTHFYADFKNGNLDRGIILWIRQILTDLESPLILDNRFDEELLKSGWQGNFLPASEKSKYNSGWFLFLLGVILVSTTLYAVVTAEIHYAFGGWFRFPTYKRWKIQLQSLINKKTNKLVSGGGVYGSW